MQIGRAGRLLRSIYSAAPAKQLGCGGEARNVVRRGASYAAASLPSSSSSSSSSSSKSPKGKKLPKGERRALIQPFVTRYRSMNAGKFPPVSLVKKELGGSYYVIREILQELEYQSKLCAPDSSNENISGKVLSKEDESFSVVEVASTAVGVQDDACMEAVDDIKFLDTNNRQVDSGRILQVDTLAEESSSEGVLKLQTPGSYCYSLLEEKGDAKSLEKQEDDIPKDAGIDSSDKFPTVPDEEKIVDASDQPLESAKTESKDTQSTFGVVEGDLVKDETMLGTEEGDKKKQLVSKEFLNAGSPELKAEQRQQFTQEEKNARNLSSEETNDAQSSKKSTLWGNLKAFAFNIWRKL